MTAENFMARALALAEKAAAAGDVPVGAVIARNGEIVAEAFNEKEALNIPSCHAEILVLERAALKLNRWRLIDCDLYVTLEPCVMCAGAIVQARLRSVTYGARDPKAGAVESIYQILSDGRLNHRPQVVSGILEKECSEILKDFFAKRRPANSQQP
ncbi:MAG: tRNA-specific adenosine deaminase [Bdellovibrionales bacterium RBG_16_40_8]|nr:MAG: tRNA-specific adenosine deaminase [Bdellovibrionales bacterium RBG_16_40_8]